MRALVLALPPSLSLPHKGGRERAPNAGVCSLPPCGGGSGWGVARRRTQAADA